MMNSPHTSSASGITLDNDSKNNVILHIISDIAQRLQDPDQIGTFMQDDFSVFSNPELLFTPTWAPLSLADGYPGLLILFVILYERGILTENKEKVIHRYIVKIKESIENAENFDLSLFSGIAGACFSLKFAVAQENRYARLLETLNSFLLKHTEKIYLEPLRASIDQKQPCLSNHYDLIQGICGVGCYTLYSSEDPLFRNLTENIVRILVDFCKPLQTEGVTVPGWYVAENDILNTSSAFTRPKGNFNLGLAHGICGVLALLANAYLKGIIVEGQKETIQKISDWICKKSFRDEKDTIRWSHTVPWEEEVGKGYIHPQKPCRDAWCYGVPGVARSLLFAGHALQDKNLVDFALQAFLGVFKRSQADWKLSGPTLCHGIAGLLLLTHGVSQESPDIDFRPQIDMLKEILLTYYNPHHPFGFQDIEHGFNGEDIVVNRAGFFGAAGVLLTLLTIAGPISKWHLPLLSHV
jgi:class I lanthipeptide synthase